MRGLWDRLYIDCGNGWYEIILTSPYDSISIEASDAFDPFDDMDDWLQEIADGSCHSVMSINSEGCEICLEYKVAGGSGCLMIWQDPVKTTGFFANVIRRLLSWKKPDMPTGFFSIAIAPEELVIAFHKNYGN